MQFLASRFSIYFSLCFYIAKTSFLGNQEQLQIEAF
nr:MAG TPA: hypothetical protein [Bacteriophage sp.]